MVKVRICRHYRNYRGELKYETYKIFTNNYANIKFNYFYNIRNRIFL